MIIAVCAFILASGIIGYFSYSAEKELQKTIMDQFNRQQLILARKIAHDIRNHFYFLETMLRRLNQFWERETIGEPRIREDIASLWPFLRNWEVLAIVHVDKVEELSAVFTDEGFISIRKLGVGYDKYWQWSANPENRDQIIIGRNSLAEMGRFEGKWLTVIATPSWKQREQEKEVANIDFEGYTYFIIDPMAIARKYTQDIRSGETGYAWILDDYGTFLAHNEPSFIGQDAFTIRQKINPHISFDRINAIVQEHFRTGKEVMDWFISGQHRGESGQIKKLFALSPVFLSRNQMDNLWSVGVVAPMSQIYGIVQSIVNKQWLLAGTFQLVVFFCLVVSIYFSLRWSQIFRDKLYEKTAALRKSRTALRLERDKVKESMQRLIEMQERFIRSERFAAIGEAAAYISHEIKNPLIVIRGFAGQIEKTVSDENHCRKLRIIQEEAKRLDVMLAAIRDFTRLSKPQKEFQNINNTIEDTLALMEQTLKEKGIDVETLLGQGLPSLLFDPQQIKQMLINLLNNAVESMTSGGRLVVSSWQDRSLIKISIEDSGIGMSPEIAEKVFNPFFTTKVKGTGLGLAVSRKIMEDHGGDISFQSEEGKGSKVVVALPVEQDKQTSI